MFFGGPGCHFEVGLVQQLRERHEEHLFPVITELLGQSPSSSSPASIPARTIALRAMRLMGPPERSISVSQSVILKIGLPSSVTAHCTTIKVSIFSMSVSVRCIPSPSFTCWDAIL